MEVGWKASTRSTAFGRRISINIGMFINTGSSSMSISISISRHRLNRPPQHRHFSLFLLPSLLSPFLPFLRPFPLLFPRPSLLLLPDYHYASGVLVVVPVLI